MISLTNHFKAKNMDGDIQTLCSFLPLSGVFSSSSMTNPFTFGHEPVSNCLMRCQGRRATIPPCFQKDPSVKGTGRACKVTLNG